MKKLILVLVCFCLCVVCLLAFTACGSSNQVSDKSCESFGDNGLTLYKGSNNSGDLQSDESIDWEEANQLRIIERTTKSFDTLVERIFISCDRQPKSETYQHTLEARVLLISAAVGLMKPEQIKEMVNGYRYPYLYAQKHFDESLAKIFSEKRKLFCDALLDVAVEPWTKQTIDDNGEQATRVYQGAEDLAHEVRIKEVTFRISQATSTKEIDELIKLVDGLMDLSYYESEAKYYGANYYDQGERDLLIARERRLIEFSKNPSEFEYKTLAICGKYSLIAKKAKTNYNFQEVFNWLCDVGYSDEDWGKTFRILNPEEQKAISEIEGLITEKATSEDWRRIFGSIQDEGSYLKIMARKKLFK